MNWFKQNWFKLAIAICAFIAVSSIFSIAQSFNDWVQYNTRSLGPELEIDWEKLKQ